VIVYLFFYLWNHLDLGKYIARVFHPGQPEFQNRNYTHDSDKTCHKCLTLLFVVLTFLGESFAGSGLFILPLVEEASLVEPLLTCFYL
jgi:hypothetical protein